MRCVAIRGTPSTLVEPRASCRANGRRSSHRGAAALPFVVTAFMRSECSG